MTKLTEQNGIYLVYDGECPMCTHTALALRIRKAYGALHLVDARRDLDHPVVKQVNDLELDLDDGMVLYDGVEFYHGKNALCLMARYGDASDIFNFAIRSFYRSDFMARMTYPFLRAIRNRLLSRKKTSPIDNLGLKRQSIFKPVFGETWDDLPPVMHKHYSNHPYSNDSSSVEGKLDVMCAGPIRWFSPMFWLMKGIPPRTEQDVDVTVEFKSDPSSKALYFDRVFNFRDRKPYRFRSKMIQTHGNEVVEIMTSRFGWRMNVIWENNRVKLKHKGYVFYLLGYFIPLPLTALLGAGNAEEVAIDDRTFDMFVEITHPLWGKIYEYRGRFRTLDKQ